jgi:2,3-bisphosphoglycerate-independent phosphoglycerate mutase
MTDGRTFIIALCGGADRPVAALGGRTPFEAARTPHLDALASRGRCGLLTVISAEVPPESDSGAMALLGYDPVQYYTGRGPLEGLGMGFWAADSSPVAFRINFASWSPATGRLDRRTSRDLTDDELEILVAEIVAGVRLDGDVTFQLTGFGRHRGILALASTGLPLSGQVSNTDPGFRNVGAFGIPVEAPQSRLLASQALADDPSAHRTAAIVNEFVARSAAVLERSEVNRQRQARGRRPANLLLIRDGGDTLPVLPAFPGTLRLYGQVPAERGLASLIGADFVVAKTARGQTDAQFYGELAPRLAGDPSEVIFAHLKGPDEPGHDGQPDAKVAAVAAIDEHFIGPLAALLGPADTLVVTCDHATPCELGIHSSDPVPAVVSGPGLIPDEVSRFTERAAADGDLPPGRASGLMPWLAASRQATGLRAGR